jgi:hypothetical protein
MRSKVTTTPHLPTELLSEILENVNEDTDTLRKVSLTCRRFRSLARPLIFRSFDLTSEIGDDLSRHIARLDFYSSDAIAPFVREFSMSTEEPEDTNLVAKIFDALPRFINVRSLSCYNIDLDRWQVALHQISRLSSLEHLVVVACIGPPKSDSLPVLRPRTFACLDHWDLDELERCHHWLALLDPDHLQVLRIPLTEDSCSFFLDSPSLCPFPSLHSVDLYVDQATLPMLLMFLSKTPTLRSLKLLPAHWYYVDYIRVMEQLVYPAACPIPYLEEYSGHHKLLPIVLGREMGFPSAHLRHVCLESFEDDDPLDTFIDSFQSCHPLKLRALTHIHISLLRSMDLKSLAKFRDMFPVLQELCLHAHDRQGQLGLSCEFSQISCPLTQFSPLSLG